MNHVGKNIKKFREMKKVTQEEMAQALFITRQAVSNWENGKTEPDIDTLQKIADFLNVTMEELIYGVKKKTDIYIQTGARNSSKAGLGIGVALAVVISYVKWHSIGWAILHGILNWVYVIYFIIKYGWNG
ncbi:MAG: helix-turn-helix transcriptional regulator [Eubacteriales bacterium]|nr:helix-turn-helix transcriptional regulator [Eubacteriales bacterium]